MAVNASTPWLDLEMDPPAPDRCNERGPPGINRQPRSAREIVVPPSPFVLGSFGW